MIAVVMGGAAHVHMALQEDPEQALPAMFVWLCATRVLARGEINHCASLLS